ncbi:hypothetical protein, unlikely [Trypanosoma brucei brucei TREU927]|uniref:Uncharacterized protein n=1 Tax=Trypanosoma brucei brucei (strain 927/4 GUTat10.1) TaxID=185431 RepID=Q4GYE5_TRYB2|nr:hypothetical protein, unlikely [Trypanosoma brucei brucei TREU927]CAJ16639.1 hypothetical protein, unlikely [Trypanosoma brucei brucei TREU927]
MGAGEKKRKRGENKNKIKIKYKEVWRITIFGVYEHKGVNSHREMRVRVNVKINK